MATTAQAKQEKGLGAYLRELGVRAQRAYPSACVGRSV